VVIDDNLKELGLNSVTKAGDIVLYTGAHGEAPKGVKLVIDYPGEYEVSDVSIRGVAARAHIDEDGKNAVVYRLMMEDLRIAVLGHIYPDLSEDQLEAIGTIDVLFVPVGGNGYTMDGIGALKLIKKIEPKLVIPTHYADKNINYPMPQQDLESVLKNMSMEPKETVSKLKLKAGDLAETTQLIVLERS
jgi:L-ascorbate metabolism protein UlaG (beta-lactamase superfamily)